MQRKSNVSTVQAAYRPLCNGERRRKGEKTEEQQRKGGEGEKETKEEEEDERKKVDLWKQQQGLLNSCLSKELVSG